MAIDWKPEYVLKIAKQMMSPKKARTKPDLPALIKRLEERNGNQVPQIK